VLDGGHAPAGIAHGRRPQERIEALGMAGASSVMRTRGRVLHPGRVEGGPQPLCGATRKRFSGKDHEASGRSMASWPADEVRCLRATSRSASWSRQGRRCPCSSSGSLFQSPRPYTHLYRSSRVRSTSHGVRDRMRGAEARRSRVLTTAPTAPSPSTLPSRSLHRVVMASSQTRPNRAHHA
jgi:hypothetical protein